MSSRVTLLIAFLLISSCMSIESSAPSKSSEEQSMIEMGNFLMESFKQLKMDKLGDVIGCLMALGPFAWDVIKVIAAIPVGKFNDAFLDLAMDVVEKFIPECAAR